MDEDFLISTNFTKELFLDVLLLLFEEKRNGYNFVSLFRKGPKTRSRRSLLKFIDLLGISLWYLKSRETLYSLCSNFEVIDSTIGAWLEHGQEVLRQVVCDQHNPSFERRWSTFEEMKQSCSLLDSDRVNEQHLKGIFAVTDGGRMPCADSKDNNMQNAYIEGFTQGVDVTNLLGYNFFGKLIHTAVNFLGSWHETKLATVSGLYFLSSQKNVHHLEWLFLGTVFLLATNESQTGRLFADEK